MILAHTRYAGQLNVPDAFTRLVQSVLVTGIAPWSFYERDADGRPQRAHYDGLPVDFVAESIVTLAAKPTDGYRSFDVMNLYDDGVSLDTFVDWLIDVGHPIARIDDHDDWPHRFETALTALPDEKRRHSVLPLLDAYGKPERPVLGAIAPAEVRQPCAVRRRGRRRRGHPPHHAVVDRQVRGRPRAPGLGLTEGVLGCQACRSQRAKLANPIDRPRRGGNVRRRTDGLRRDVEVRAVDNPDGRPGHPPGHRCRSGEVQGKPDTLNANVRSSSPRPTSPPP